MLDQLKGKLTDTNTSDDIVLLEERQLYHIQKIESNLNEAITLLETGAPAEIYIQEINYAIKEVGEINGHVDNEEILGRIFSKFCVGK